MSGLCRSFLFSAKKCVPPLYPTDSYKHSSNTPSTWITLGEGGHWPFSKYAPTSNISASESEYFLAFPPSPVLHHTSMNQISYHSSARQRGTWKWREDEKGSADETFSRKVSFSAEGAPWNQPPGKNATNMIWKCKNVQIFWLAPFNVDLAGGLVDGGRVPCHLAWVSNLSICTLPQKSWPLLYI